jgi:hypothetical protein
MRHGEENIRKENCSINSAAEEKEVQGENKKHGRIEKIAFGSESEGERITEQAIEH